MHAEEAVVVALVVSVGGGEEVGASHRAVEASEGAVVMDLIGTVVTEVAVGVAEAAMETVMEEDTARVDIAEITVIERVVMGGVIEKVLDQQVVHLIQVLASDLVHQLDVVDAINSNTL